MNGRIQKLLRRYYSTFIYRDPQIFWEKWRQIKKSWHGLSRPEKHEASVKMRNMLVRFERARARTVSSMPLVNAIKEAGTLLDKQGLPYDA